jgi:hypothetical protein
LAGKCDGLERDEDDTEFPGKGAQSGKKRARTFEVKFKK